MILGAICLCLLLLDVARELREFMLYGMWLLWNSIVWKHLLAYSLFFAGSLKRLTILKVDQNQLLHLTSNIGKYVK